MRNKPQLTQLQFWIIIAFDVFGIVIIISLLFPTQFFEIYKASNPSLGPMLGAFLAFILAIISLEFNEKRKISLQNESLKDKTKKMLAAEISQINIEIRDLLYLIRIISDPSTISEQKIQPESSFPYERMMEKVKIIYEIINARGQDFSKQRFPIFSNSLNNIFLLDKEIADKIIEFYNKLDVFSQFSSKVEMNQIIQHRDLDDIKEQMTPVMINYIHEYLKDSEDLLKLLNSNYQ